MENAICNDFPRCRRGEISHSYGGGVIQQEEHGILNQMELHETDGAKYLTFPALEQYLQLLHPFFTRIGGASEGEFESLNFCRGDSRESIPENYRRICRAVGYDFDGLVASAQDHHTVLRYMMEQKRGIGITKPRDMESVDSLYTDVPSITLVTSYADCASLYSFDPAKNAVALAHAGWCGTVQRIGEKMTETLCRQFGCSTQDILAVVGPSIGPCYYEVDETAREQVTRHTDLLPGELFAEQGNGKYLLDLWECSRWILVLAGIPDENISVGEVCMKYHPELFFFHRLVGDRRGGMVAMMCLKEARSFDF